MSWNKTIRQVKIGTGVTAIGDNTFTGASSLTSIKIPSSVTSIGASAFSDTEITEVDIDDIGSFCNITFGDYYSHPNSVTACDLKVNGSICTDLVIPSGISNISSHLFSFFWSLDTVTIPQSVTSIGAHSFQDCGALTRVDFGGPCSIGSYAFYSCDSLSNVYMLTETMEQVQGKAYYPWGLLAGCTIHCKDGNLVIQGSSSGYDS